MGVSDNTELLLMLSIAQIQLTGILFNIGKTEATKSTSLIIKTEVMSIINYFVTFLLLENQMQAHKI